MAINKDLINQGVDVAFKAASIGQRAVKVAKRNSIMRMAAPGLYQYPIMMSGSIETDVAMAIAKAYQQTYASAVVTAYSLNPVMYLTKYKEPTDFVQKFHTNSQVPTNWSAAANALGHPILESNIEINKEIMDAEVTSAMEATNFSSHDLQILSRRSFEPVTESLDMTSINDMYRPFDRTCHQIERRLDMIDAAKESATANAEDNAPTKRDVALESKREIGKGVAAIIRKSSIATEAAADDLNSLNDALNGIGDIVNRHNGKAEQANSPFQERTRTFTDKSKTIYDKNKKTSTKYADKKEVITNKPIQRNFTNGVVRNDKLEAMEPTMVNVQIVCHGEKQGQFTQNLTLGVKTTVRTVQTDLMIASIIEAVKDSNFIFKFLKWTDNEKKTLDFVLGISAAKKKALQKNAKMEVKVLQQAKKRRKYNSVSKWLDNGIMPTLTIVMTSYEVMMVKEVCGVDLNDLASAMKLMNKYFLLSFAIYDEGQNTLKTIFDGDDDWSYVSVAAMKSMMNKTTDLLNERRILETFGKR